jgi:predicted outer membrane repeat protein
LFFSEGNVTIINSIFKNNLSRGNGGAISGSGDGTLIITGSLFINNTAANINKTDGNGDRANGGAINVFGNGREVIMSENTFYNNEATFQGGGLFFGGLNVTSSLENITVFENKVSLSSSEAGRAGGIRIEGDRTFEIKNSLIYDNRLGDTENQESDINVASVVELNLINSLSGSSEGLGSDDTYGSSKIDAVLTSSNLRFNEISDKVEYDEAPNGDDTPIDFGDDGNDAGAWNSMLVLSVDDTQVSNDNFEVHFYNLTKSIKVFSSNNLPLDIKIYTIHGAKVLEKNYNNPRELINIAHLKPGVYIINVMENGIRFSRKFILY